MTLKSINEKLGGSEEMIQKAMNSTNLKWENQNKESQLSPSASSINTPKTTIISTGTKIITAIKVKTEPIDEISKKTSYSSNPSGFFSPNLGNSVDHEAENGKDMMIFQGRSCQSSHENNTIATKKEVTSTIFLPPSILSSSPTSISTVKSVSNEVDKLEGSNAVESLLMLSTVTPPIQSEISGATHQKRTGSGMDIGNLLC